MRVVLVNRYFHPDESATSRMVSSLAFGLAAAGVDIEIVTGRYRHDDPSVALSEVETVDGVRVNRIATTHFGRARLPGRAADYGSFHLAAAFWCLTHIRRGDIVIACTDPPLLSVSLAAAIAPRGGVLVNWLHDIFPEVAIELGLIRRQGNLARLTLALRDRSLRCASVNVVPTAAMARGLEHRNLGGAPVALVPYWSEENEIRPIAPADNRLRQDWGFEAASAFVVGYSGNFGRAHDFATILGAAELLLGDARIRFCLVGGGYGSEQVEREIRSRRLTNILLQPLQPRARLAESLSVADLHLVSLLPQLEPYVVPSKLYGIMAAGRPVVFIGADDGEVATVLRSREIGHSVAVGEGSALAARILDLQRDPEARLAMGRRARAAFEADHVRARGVAAWRRLLETIAPGKADATLSTPPYSAEPDDTARG